MKDNYDFSKGVKNPHADKLKHGYAVTVHYDFANGNSRKENINDKEIVKTDMPQKQA